MTLNGTYRFKTKEQLENSGWVLKDNSYLIPGLTTPVVLPKMIEELGGKMVEVIEGKSSIFTYWTIIPEMVLMEQEIVTEILNKYGEKH